MSMKANGTVAADKPLKPITIERRLVGTNDVQIESAFCGVCHSDLHQARSESQGTHYPCVPGHEILGRITAVGTSVNRFKVGEVVGFGCMVDSCPHCISTSAPSTKSLLSSK